MPEPLVILSGADGHIPALLFAGHDLAPDEVVEAAVAWLGDRIDVWARHKARQVAVPAQAWWGGDEVGFCQSHHDGAVAVTAVQLEGVAF